MYLKKFRENFYANTEPDMLKDNTGNPESYLPSRPSIKPATALLSNVRLFASTLRDPSDTCAHVVCCDHCMNLTETFERHALLP